MCTELEVNRPQKMQVSRLTLSEIIMVMHSNTNLQFSTLFVFDPSLASGGHLVDVLPENDYHPIRHTFLPT